MYLWCLWLWSIVKDLWKSATASKSSVLHANISARAVYDTTLIKLFTANRLGIDAVGVPADKRDYYYIRNYWVRELAATLVAWWQVTVSHPLPVMGEELPIFPTE